MIARWTDEHTVRVYSVADLRRGRVYGVTCDVNERGRWIAELIAKYGGDTSAVTSCVDLVNPADMAIPYDPDNAPEVEGP